MDQRTKDRYTLDKAIIACEQLRKARKKAKRWKRKYLTLKGRYKTLVADYGDLQYSAWKGGAE